MFVLSFKPQYLLPKHVQYKSRHRGGGGVKKEGRNYEISFSKYNFWYATIFQTRVTLQDLLWSTVTLPPEEKGDQKFEHQKTQTRVIGWKQAHPIIPRSEMFDLEDTEGQLS